MLFNIFEIKKKTLHEKFTPKNEKSDETNKFYPKLRMIGKSIFPTVSFDIQPHSSVVNLKVASVFLLSGHKINENQKIVC